MPVQIDMEMPKECEKCKFCINWSIHPIGNDLRTYVECHLVGWHSFPMELRKSPGCPLREVE